MCSWFLLSGVHLKGEKSGSQRTVELFLEDNLVTMEQIKNNYDIKKQQ